MPSTVLLAGAGVLEGSGGEIDAPATLGSDRRPPLEAAPGASVLDRVL